MPKREHHCVDRQICVLSYTNTQTHTHTTNGQDGNHTVQAMKALGLDTMLRCIVITDVAPMDDILAAAAGANAIDPAPAAATEVYNPQRLVHVQRQDDDDDLPPTLVSTSDEEID